MKNTFFKVLALTLTLVMAMSFAVQAAPALEKGNAVDGVVTVSVTDVAATDEVTLLVVKAGVSLSSVVADDIYYIDQTTAADGAATFSFSIDTEEFDVYSGYSSMAVDSLPLSALYATGGGEEGGDDPVVPAKPTVDEAASKLYSATAPYGLEGYRRVFIKLTEENGAWTPAHADADSAIFYAPEVEGYDGLVKTTSADLTSILNEITWANEAPSADATIAKYGDMSGDSSITIGDCASVVSSIKNMVSYSLKQNLTADTNEDNSISIGDAALMLQVIKDKLEKFPVASK